MLLPMRFKLRKQGQAGRALARNTAPGEVKRLSAKKSAQRSLQSRNADARSTTSSSTNLQALRFSMFKRGHPCKFELIVYAPSPDRFTCSKLRCFKWLQYKRVSQARAASP